MKIKNRWTDEVIFESDDETMKATVERANLKGADLKGADLEGAYLKRAYLEGADLEGAYLEGAYLEGADLEGAYLKGADLEGAYLKGANLKRANLKGADLKGADLKGAYLKRANLERADLEGANLERAYLKGANLEGADLEPIKIDFFVVLLHGLPEIEFLKKNIIEGKINGSTYEGECACLSGTLYNGATLHNGIQEADIKNKILACRDADRPIERFFIGIQPGDTPENSQFSKLALEWLEEFESLIGNHKAAPTATA